MKWIYILIVSGLVAAAFTSDTVRGYFTGSSSGSETAGTGDAGSSSRLGEMEDVSRASRDAGK